MEPNKLFTSIPVQDLVKIGVERDIINKLVSMYEFGERSIYDLYAKPLLVKGKDVLEVLISWSEGIGINALVEYLVAHPKSTKDSLATIFTVNPNIMAECDSKYKDHTIRESKISAVVPSCPDDSTVVCSVGTLNNVVFSDDKYTSITRADSLGLTILGEEATGSRVLNVGSPNSIVSMAKLSTIVLDSAGLRSTVVSLGDDARVVSSYAGNDDVYLYGNHNVYCNMPADRASKGVTDARVEVHGSECKLIMDIPVKEIFPKERTIIIVGGNQIHLTPGKRYEFDVDSYKYLVK